jgi:putative copper resistance protein D
MTAVFAVVRAAHFLSLMTIFGAASLRALFLLSLPAPPVSRVSIQLFPMGACVALASALFWFGLTVAQVGGGAAAVISLQTIWIVITQTSFGPVFLARITLTGLLVATTFFPQASVAPIVLSAAALGAISLTSHAAASGDSFTQLRVANDAAHLLTAGFWIGALVELVPLVIAERKSAKALVPPLRVFSRWGAIPVAVLITTGAFNGIMILHTSAARWSPGYLTLLAAKVVLAGLMVSLALTNRYSLLPDVRLGLPEAAENLAGSVVAEFAIGMIIVCIVGVLGLVAPTN